MDHRHPPAEVHIDADLVAALLEQQLPHLDGSELTFVDEGWDNVTYHTGSDYAVRIPRREVAVELILNEQKWLPIIASWLPIAVPRPVGIGVPSALFPWPWSVVEWIPVRRQTSVPAGPPRRPRRPESCGRCIVLRLPTRPRTRYAEFLFRNDSM